jgi:hypothetical protein
MDDFQLKNTTLYTHDRIEDYLQHYTDYVTTIEGKSQSELYQYYHFDYSPNGIKKVDVGRVPSGLFTGQNPNPTGSDPTFPLDLSNYPNPVKSWIPYNTNQNASATTQLYNTPDGWLMELAILYSKVKNAELNKYKNLTIVPGLTFNIITDFSFVAQAPGQLQNQSPYLTNPQSYITLFSNPSIKISTTGQCKTTMDTLNRAINLPSTGFIDAATAVGIEWFGYFKPPTLGYYTFTIDAGEGFCAIWFDDDAVFDYTDKNAYFTSPSVLPKTVQITEPKYYAIRIQYFADSVPNLSSGQRQFGLTIMNNQTNQEVNTNDVLFTINNNTYYPPLLYCAFVSTSVQNFSLGKFQCYICNTADTTKGDPANFWNVIQKYKFNLEAGMYNYDRGTPNQVNYQTLPDGTNYTDIYTVNSLYPSTFSIYRIDVDTRMGNTYQIDTKSNNGFYKMNPLNRDLLLASDSYNQVSDYYADITNAFQTDPETCKIMCNQSDKCNYYFTYTSNGIDQCVNDTTNSIPNFTQIRPTGNTVQSNVDAGSSNLFMRNFELHPPPCAITGPISVQPVVATTNYTPAFPYSQYDLDLKPINDLSFVGVCGDSSYQTISQGAYDILFKDTLYSSNGSWENSVGSWKTAEGFSTSSPSSSPSASTPSSSTLSPFAPPATPVPTKYTNALSDTRDLANTNLQNEEMYARLQKTINQNYNVLGESKIPNYIETRTIMMDNPNYDYNGNILLYYRNKPIPNGQEKMNLDAIEGYQTQNSLYILGTLTAATLLVLAILIGRE